MNEKLVNEIVKLNQDYQNKEKNFQEKTETLTNLHSECQKLENLKEAHKQEEKDYNNKVANLKENVKLFHTNN